MDAPQRIWVEFFDLQDLATEQVSAADVWVNDVAGMAYIRADLAPSADVVMGLVEAARPFASWWREYFSKLCEPPDDLKRLSIEVLAENLRRISKAFAAYEAQKGKK